MNNIVFLSGRKVNLRPYDKEKDLRNLLQWISDSEIRRFVSSNAQFPKSLDKEEKELQKLTESSDNIFFVIETKKHKPIGCMGLHKVDWINRTAESGASIGEKKFQNKGYGTDAKMILLNYAFNTLNLRKINSSVFAFNKRSLAYNNKCGYKIEGVFKKQYFRNGEYHDSIMIAVFKEDFQKIWNSYQKSR